MSDLSDVHPRKSEGVCTQLKMTITCKTDVHPRKSEGVCTH